MSEEKFDWREVVDRNPRGYAELNDGKACIHGPVESVVIDGNDFVHIKLKWAAKIALGEVGIPQGAWKPHRQTEFVFLNLCVPYIVEETHSTKGPRVRFGRGSIIYFDVESLEESGVDPKKIGISA